MKKAVISIAALAAVALTGCLGITKTTSYTAIGKYAGLVVRQDSKIKDLAVETSAGIDFIIPFRADQEIFMKENTVGELHYHSCGKYTYCFDYYKPLK